MLRRTAVGRVRAVAARGGLRAPVAPSTLRPLVSPTLARSCGSAPPLPAPNAAPRWRAPCRLCTALVLSPSGRRHPLARRCHVVPGAPQHGAAFRPGAAPPGPRSTPALRRRRGRLSGAPPTGAARGGPGALGSGRCRASVALVGGGVTPRATSHQRVSLCGFAGGVTGGAAPGARAPKPQAPPGFSPPGPPAIAQVCTARRPPGGPARIARNRERHARARVGPRRFSAARPPCPGAV